MWSTNFLLFVCNIYSIIFILGQLLEIPHLFQYFDSCNHFPIYLKKTESNNSDHRVPTTRSLQWCSIYEKICAVHKMVLTAGLTNQNQLQRRCLNLVAVDHAPFFLLWWTVKQNMYMSHMTCGGRVWSVNPDKESECLSPTKKSQLVCYNCLMTHDPQNIFPNLLWLNWTSKQI